MHDLCAIVFLVRSSRRSRVCQQRTGHFLLDLLSVKVMEVY